MSGLILLVVHGRGGNVKCKTRPLHAMKLFMLCFSLMAMLTACTDHSDLSKEQREAVQKAHEDAVKKCEGKWLGQPRVPVRGSKYVLDATRLYWQMEFGSWNKDEECGAAAIIARFYWTGEKIVPDKIGLAPQRSQIEPIDVPKDWIAIDLEALVGVKPDVLRHCEQHPEDCKKKTTDRAKGWPPELVVPLKHYPELEVRLPKELTPKMKTGGFRALGIFLREWPMDSGAPRSFLCHLDQDVYAMTREEIENINFGSARVGQQRSYCQMEFNNFRFNGGQARVVWGTEALPQITPALRALHQYLNESITEE